MIPEKSGVRKKANEEIDCDDYCDKPIDIFEFSQKIHSLIDSRHRGDIVLHDMKEINNHGT